MKSPRKMYVNDNIWFVDLVDVDKFSTRELDTMTMEISYRKPVHAFYHFWIPYVDLDFGFHILGNHQDVLNILKNFAKRKVAKFSLNARRPS